MASLHHREAKKKKKIFPAPKTRFGFLSLSLFHSFVLRSLLGWPDGRTDTVFRVSFVSPVGQ